MRSSVSFSLAGALSLGGCNSAKKPNADNLTKAINQYFVKNGPACVFFAQTFPIDVLASEVKDEAGTPAQMAALEKAGLVRGTDTTAVVHGMVGALGASAPRSVRRYALTDEGKKYSQVKPSGPGQSSAFCYGQEQVDSIVKWDQPTTQDGTSATEVTYTYKFQHLADWAKQPDVEQAFPAIKSTVEQAETNQTIEVHLTNKGWEAGS